MPNALTQQQLAILASAHPDGTTPTTIRIASELRWLDHLGLLALAEGARYALTDAGRRAVADRIDAPGGSAS